MNVRELIEYILEQRSDLTESELLSMVAEKKEKVGAGYLTDQGALFLVAADLGINIERPNLDLSLKDLYAGARNINVIGRILKIYPIKRILRSDGSTAMLRTLVIYDNDAKVRLTLWDSIAMLPDTLNLKVGDVIRISNVYSRSSPDGKINLSSSNKTTVEVENKASNITPIDRLALDPSEIMNEDDNLVIDGKISLPPRITTFINNKGERSKVLHMQISGIDKDIRVIIWNVDEKSLPKIIKKGDKCRLVGFKAKKNQFGSIELHGDEGSNIQLETDKGEPDLIQLRIVSLIKRDNEGLALAIDKDKNVYLVSITNSFLSIDEIMPNMIIQCIPSKIYGNTLILDEDSYAKIEEEDDLPTPDMLEIKINNIKPDEDRFYFIEAITLLPAKVQEVQVKDETIKYAEILVGDDTGEVRVVGWREAANMIESLNVGKRIKIYGASAALSNDGSIELRLKPFSVIL